MKKVLSIAIANVLLMFCTQAFAGEKDERFVVDKNGNLQVVDKDALIGDVVIPSTWGDYTVTTIQDYNAFSECNNMTSVTFPNTLTSITNVIFSNCANLEQISLPESLIQFGGYGNPACWDGCPKLTTISVAEGNPNYASVDGVLYNRDISTIIQCPMGKIGNITFPSTLKTVASSSFSFSKLSEINIPEGVTTIEASAFYGCSENTTIRIPKSASNLSTENGGFLNNCSAKLVFAEGNENLIDGVFYSSDENGNPTLLVWCSPEKESALVMPNTVTTIGEQAFRGCSKITSVTLSDNLVFSANVVEGLENLESVIVSDNCQNYKVIDNVLYRYNKKKNTIAGPIWISPTIETYVVPEGISSITLFDFRKCFDLKEIILHENVTKWSGRDLQSIEKITVADENATFSSEDGVLFNKEKTAIIYYPSAKSNTEYTITSEIDSIGKNAFLQCGSLQTLLVLATNPPKISENSFDNYKFTVVVPNESLALYKSDPIWSNFNLKSDKETAITKVSNATAVTIVNGQILVNGEAPAFVVTVSGQKIANANLKAGVYFVVAEGETVKVVVR
ncbi:MAG: leucine-rich repeat protein [Bacteroidales bacterium]|nr:leucine-rich repeat protein [Bacteroidales bacterium]MBR4498086.1 leucine-rich repeat protein [Bacteroidales bacterium]